MKLQITTLLLFSSLTFFTAGCKKENGSADNRVGVVVVKDCTGNYLRYEGKEYKICNGTVAAPFSDGTPASAVFTTIADCENPDSVSFCSLYHAHEGWIEVQQLNWLLD